MKTYFAVPERLSKNELAYDIEVLSNNTVINGILNNVYGMLIILNRYRQIVSVNSDFRTFAGIDSMEDCLGLRPGEAVKCAFSDIEPGGCGTSKYCSSCGAAVSIVTSIFENRPVSRYCVLKQKDGLGDLILKVNARPLKVNNETYTLLFCQDVTIQQQHAFIQRVFFHDISNRICMLENGMELLRYKYPSKLSETVYNNMKYLSKDVSMQSYLVQSESTPCTPDFRRIFYQEIFDRLKVFFDCHPVATDKCINFEQNNDFKSFRSDSAILSRILINMILNALEASGKGDEVRVWTESDAESIVFKVHNKKFISEDVALRIFQRNFSTKSDAGRGLGTFSMKLFGEQLLGGEVDFFSSESKGTVFFIKLNADYTK